MKVLSVTAGAAAMYCGSCLRDNALAAELLARGHDVTLLPLYTPTLTDEPNVSRDQVLFGGISIYLQQRSAIFRKMPRLVDRLLDSPWLIRMFTQRSSSTDPRMLGALTISMLEGVDGVLRREFDKLVEWIAGEPVPDVINLPNSMLIALARPLREASGRPVCCTLQGEELFLSGLREPYRSRAIALIQQQVPHVDRFIAVSDYCARFMGGMLEIPSGQIAVVPLGVPGQAGRAGQAGQAGQAESAGRASQAGRAGLAGQARRDGVLRVAYLGRVAPEKGLHLLADAYRRFRARVPDARARLDAAGYLAPADAAYFASVERSLEQAGLGGEFEYHGAVDRAQKAAFLDAADLFSMPATYDEPKGMSILEAMAAGVPVVQPRRGAFVEIVERTGGGLLVEPDDADSLADGLERLYREADLREQLGRRAIEGVSAHYTVQRSADRLLATYEDVIGRASPRLVARGA